MFSECGVMRKPVGHDIFTCGPTSPVTNFNCYHLYSLCSVILMSRWKCHLQSPGLLDAKFAETMSSEEWLKAHSITAKKLNLKDLVDKGQIAK